MSSSILRVVLSRSILHRPIYCNGVRNIYEFHPTPVGPDPNINLHFHESLKDPLPLTPRTIGFDGELKALKEKEKGDWKKLTQEERMDLYNMYFSMSVADMCRSTDEYKAVFGIVCCLLAFTLMIHWVCHKYLLQPYPDSMTDPEVVRANIKLQLQMRSNPITGYPSMWDYENNCWKK